MSSETKEEIIKFLFKDDAINGVLIEDDTELLRSGIIDSLKIVEMISYIEEAFSIYFEESDMVEDNLNSINNIVNFIEKKRATKS